MMLISYPKVWDLLKLNKIIKPYSIYYKTFHVLTVYYLPIYE